MTRIYARTREREKAWKLGCYAAGGSLIAAPIVTIIFKGWIASNPIEVWAVVASDLCDHRRLMSSFADALYLFTHP